MNLRDTLERLWWTFVAAFISTLLGSPVLVALVEALNATPAVIDISPLGYAVIAGAVAGLTAVANAVLLIARARLAVLPDPGAGLPGLPTPLPIVNGLITIKVPTDSAVMARQIADNLKNRGT